MRMVCERGVVGGSVGGLIQEMTDGVTRYDEENVAGSENGLGADHDPREIEDVGSGNIVPWVPAHDFRSGYWVGVKLYEATGVDQFEDVGVALSVSHG